MPKLPTIKTFNPVSKIQNKTKRVTEPIRFPKVQKPLESGFEKQYVKMLDNMGKMLQIELLNQIKK
jgi:hypothetical protein